MRGIRAVVVEDGLEIWLLVFKRDWWSRRTGGDAALVVTQSAQARPSYGASLLQP